MFDGEVELDESYFGGARKGKRDGWECAKVVGDAKANTLMPIITGKTSPGSIIFMDSYRYYDELNVTDYFQQRINHSKEFTEGENHISWIEKFWYQPKILLIKGNVIPNESCPFFKKHEFRFCCVSLKKQPKKLRGWAET